MSICSGMHNLGHIGQRGVLQAKKEHMLHFEIWENMDCMREVESKESVSQIDD